VRVRRKAIIGTVQQYANLENAWQASNCLRVSINETRNRQREQAVTVADLVDHCGTTELVDDLADGGKSHAACHDPDGIGRRMCQHSFENSEESFLSI
jgi:hypothetical protein